MPVYNYKCNDCDTSFEVRHSMFFEDQTCIKCGSSCIFKVPSLLKKNTTNNITKVGKIVDKFIIDTKSEIKKEKDKLRSEEL